MRASAELRFDVDGFSYEPTTGCIFKSGRRRDFGSSDYRKVHSMGVQVLAHRLAWRLHYGNWPVMDLDHKNQNKQDNRIDNLRLATRPQNEANKPANKNSKSGERCVYWCNLRKTWKVCCQREKVFIFYASHKLSAILAARLIRRTLNGEFAARAILKQTE